MQPRAPCPQHPPQTSCQTLARSVAPHSAEIDAFWQAASIGACSGCWWLWAGNQEGSAGRQVPGDSGGDRSRSDHQPQSVRRSAGPAAAGKGSGGTASERMAGSSRSGSGHFAGRSACFRSATVACRFTSTAGQHRVADVESADAVTSGDPEELEHEGFDLLHEPRVKPWARQTLGCSRRRPDHRYLHTPVLHD